MLSLGVFIVLALTTLFAFSSLAVASRLTRPGADAALATSLLTCAGILLCVHTLGFTHLLSSMSLALASVFVASLAFWGAARRGSSLRAHIHETIAFGEATLARGWSLFGEIRQAGPFAWVAVVLLLFALGFTTLLTWLLPSDSWDGVWYHDMMVGHAIQSHSYEEIPMSASYMQQANGHPRNAEMLGLWWVIFSNRRLLELPSVLAIVPTALAIYALCTRFAPKQRGTAFLTAVAFVLLPAVRLEMRTTYMDGSLAAFSLAALYYAYDTELRSGRSALASVAIGLALGTKSHALLWAPFLAVLAIALVALNEGLTRWRQTLLAFGVGVGVITALGGVTYLRNILWYDNPFHPFTVVIAGHEFTGRFALDDAHDMYDVTKDLFIIPISGGDWPDIRRGGYGLISGFVLLPIAALVALVLVVGVLFHTVRSIQQRQIVSELKPRVVLLLVFLSVAVALLGSPQIWSARYNLYVVGFAFCLVHWLASTLKKPRFADHFAGAAFVTNCVLWCWSLPGWWGTWNQAYGWSELRTVLSQPRWKDVGGPYTRVNQDTAIARERELRKGDVVVFGDDSGFCSLLWNESYSNRLVYVASRQPEEFVNGALTVNARWISAGSNANLAYLRAHPDEWSEVGPVHNWGSEKMWAFRRVVK